MKARPLEVLMELRGKEIRTMTDEESDMVADERVRLNFQRAKEAEERGEIWPPVGTTAEWLRQKELSQKAASQEQPPKP